MTETITIQDALTTLSRAAGGCYVSIDCVNVMFHGRQETSWDIWRADKQKTYSAATLPAAMVEALKGK